MLLHAVIAATRAKWGLVIDMSGLKFSGFDAGGIGGGGRYEVLQVYSALLLQSAFLLKCALLMQHALLV